MTILSLRNKLGKGLRLRFRKEVSIFILFNLLCSQQMRCVGKLEDRYVVLSLLYVYRREYAARLTETTDPALIHYFDAFHSRSFPMHCIISHSSINSIRNWVPLGSRARDYRILSERIIKPHALHTARVYR